MTYRQTISASMMALPLTLALAAPACSSSTAAEEDDEGSPTPSCTADAECTLGEWCTEGSCTEPTDAWPLGQGDGSAASVGLTYVFAPSVPREVTDIAFDPKLSNRLWILMREFESDQVCTSSSNCAGDAYLSLEGKTAILDNPATDDAFVQVITDPNAWHFMRRPTSLAMTPDGNFATVHEARTGNFFGDDVDFIGPSLWSTDLSIYGIQPDYPGANGSHLDMLHQTPYGMGITWGGTGNMFYVFNGDVGAIDQVDFAADHGPGADDHSDGTYRRYVAGQLARVENIPSHLAMEGNWLYIADTGNGRVVRLDVSTGVDEGDISPVYEPLAYSSMVQGATLEEVVPAGTLSQPSGLAIRDGLLYVSDYATKKISAFDLEGNLVRELQLDIPNGITGLHFGPEGRLYFVEKDVGNVWRIEPRL